MLKCEINLWYLCKFVCDVGFTCRYLNEFRTKQCPEFLQHKCTQHRPFTCFNWHFANQKRRRPVQRKDGTFNYSADVYCTKYDETTGLCPDGDECVFFCLTEILCLIYMQLWLGKSVVHYHTLLISLFFLM